LCNKPVPVNRNELPDFKVSEHIDRDCQSDPALSKRKSNIQPCPVPRCKETMFVRVECSNCRHNFCLKHRHVLDHECKGFDDSGRSITKSGIAALNRFKENIMSPSKASASISTLSTGVNGLLNEDEALAKAVHLSLNDSSGHHSSADKKPNQEELDRRLAEALSMGEEAYAAELRRQHETKKQCIIT